MSESAPSEESFVLFFRMIFPADSSSSVRLIQMKSDCWLLLLGPVEGLEKKVKQINFYKLLSR